jgi:hypothetical protein
MKVNTTRVKYNDFTSKYSEEQEDRKATKHFPLLLISDLMLKGNLHSHKGHIEFDPLREEISEVKLRVRVNH